jgi:trehalose utilization protein
MPDQILIVGGCPASYHRLEAAEPPLRAALAEIDFEATVSGIHHPDGGDSFVGDYSALNEAGLRNYDALLLYTTGNERFGADPSAVINFVRGGKALVAIHNAADSFTDDPEFVRLIGGKFRTHPAQLDIEIRFADARHPIVTGLAPYTVFDELYLYSDYDPGRVHLLAQTSSFDDNGPVPVCWVREEGHGRVFYLSLGHNAETMRHPTWVEMFKRGVQWAMGRL